MATSARRLLEDVKEGTRLISDIPAAEWVSALAAEIREGQAYSNMVGLTTTALKNGGVDTNSQTNHQAVTMLLKENQELKQELDQQKQEGRIVDEDEESLHDLIVHYLTAEIAWEYVPRHSASDEELALVGLQRRQFRQQVIDRLLPKPRASG